MNLKTVYATLAGGVVSFLLGWLVYGLLLMSFYTNNTQHYEGLMKAQPDMILISLSCLIMAFFLTYVFQCWAGFKTFVKGLSGGLIIGILMALVFDLSSLSMMNLFSVKVALVDVIVSGIVNAIVGGVIGWILGMGKKPAQA